MMSETLMVICPGNVASERYILTLKAVLKGTSARVRTYMDGPLETSASCLPCRWTRVV